MASNCINSSPCYDLRIIVPCYNVGQYVKKCIDSIIMQKTRYSIEIYIIDDGSTDDTPILIDAYRQLPNVKVIRQQNQGLSGARNAGLRILNSKFTMFLDADDYLLSDRTVDLLLSTAYRLAKKDKNVIVQCNYSSIYSDHSVNNRKIKNGICKPSDFYGMAWGKVFSSSIFKTVQFPPGYWFEDTVDFMVLYQLADCLGSIDFYGYGYTIRGDSISHTALDNPKSLDALYVLIRLLDDAARLGIDTSSRLYANMLMERVFIMYLWTNRLSESIHRAIFVVVAQTIKKYRVSLRVAPQYVGLRNALGTLDYGKYSFNCRLINRLRIVR